MVLMNASAPIRITGDPLSVFEDVLRSLESHRPSKAERDILDEIQERFQLPRNRKKWPSLLANRTTVEEFLDYTLGLLSPFVEMVLDIYAFLSEYVSTTGGRTTHFEIDSHALSQPWRFEHVNFPKRVRWITTWAEVNIEQVVINWSELGRLLVIDNGIFYGTIDDIRLVQSLIIARREGELSPRLRQIGDQIHVVIRRAAGAWYRRASFEQEDDVGDRRNWRFLAFVPHLYEFLARRRLINPNLLERPNIAIDLDAVLGGGVQPRSVEQVFGDLDPARHRALEAVTGEERRRDWNIGAAIFFCSLWSLEDRSFQQVASLLTAHEERDDLLRGADLEMRGEALGRRLLERLEQLIVPTGESESANELTRQKLELLLLPYWKDRWFLFEVWTLLRPLTQAISMGARIDLVGVEPISNAGVEGETWNLPTQKAKSPVARIQTDGTGLLVWFQRETRRYDQAKNIEPDVRITLPWSPFPDVAIIECKDRVRFGGRKVKDLAHGYLTGSAARVVWIVNYEESRKGWEETLEPADEDRSLGFAYRFRPNEIGAGFESSLDTLFREHLHMQKAQAAEEYLVIDVSGSMDGKQVSHLDVVQSFTGSSPSRVTLWSNGVADADDAQRRAVFEGSISGHGMGHGAESSEALAKFAETLPEDAQITVVTDSTGKPKALAHAIQQGDEHRLKGRKLSVICV